VTHWEDHDLLPHPRSDYEEHSFYDNYTSE
jgi:hypothetical protein